MRRECAVRGAHRTGLLLLRGEFELRASSLRGDGFPHARACIRHSPCVLVQAAERPRPRRHLPVVGRRRDVLMATSVDLKRARRAGCGAEPCIFWLCAAFLALMRCSVVTPRPSVCRASTRAGRTRARSSGALRGTVPVMVRRPNLAISGSASFSWLSRCAFPRSSWPFACSARSSTRHEWAGSSWACCAATTCWSSATALTRRTP
jgi:hypothetical protein